MKETVGQWLNMRKTTAGFQMKVSREQYLATVKPWLAREIGYKRGDKADWSERIIHRPAERRRPETFVPTRRHPVPPPLRHETFHAHVQIRGHVNAIRFLLRFEDIIVPHWGLDGESRVKSAKTYVLKQEWKDAKPTLRWLATNLREHAWAVDGGNEGPFRIHTLNDEANMAIKMLAGVPLVRV